MSWSDLAVRYWECLSVKKLRKSIRTVYQDTKTYSCSVEHVFLIAASCGHKLLACRDLAYLAHCLGAFSWLSLSSQWLWVVPVLG